MKTNEIQTDTYNRACVAYDGAYSIHAEACDVLVSTREAFADACAKE
jgi:hypothetical protein